jgi:arsenate reductase (glutaredoxin)
MKVLKVYHYNNCSTCKTALKFLANNRYAVEKVDIFTTPPSKAEIKKMIAFQEGNFRRLFNTTGRVYQEKNLAAKVGTMTEDEAINLLASDGKLIRRPFILTEEFGLVGFKEEFWKKQLK